MLRLSIMLLCSVLGAAAWQNGLSNAVSTSTTLTIGKATPVFTVASSQNPTLFGNSITFTCTGTSSGQPLVNGAYMAIWVDGTLFENMPTTGGTFQWSTSSLSVGSHSIGCTGGGANYNDAGTNYTQIVEASEGAVIYQYNITNPSGGSGYAPNANIANYTDSIMGTWAQTYDTLNRLGSAHTTAVTNTSGQYSGNWGCWVYDPFGNRTSESMSTTACAATPPLQRSG